MHAVVCHLDSSFFQSEIAGKRCQKRPPQVFFRSLGKVPGKQWGSTDKHGLRSGRYRLFQAASNRNDSPKNDARRLGPVHAPLKDALRFKRALAKVRSLARLATQAMAF
ncbi:MAG: hypothetical protein Q4A28_10505 [Brachymonas sp.]|nr:hypothetical protein [Brachymonas sp.]